MTTNKEAQRSTCDKWIDENLPNVRRDATGRYVGYEAAHTHRVWQAALESQKQAERLGENTGSLANGRQSVKENTDATNNQECDSSAPITFTRDNGILVTPQEMTREEAVLILYTIYMETNDGVYNSLAAAYNALTTHCKLVRK